MYSPRENDIVDGAAGGSTTRDHWTPPHDSKSYIDWGPSAYGDSLTYPESPHRTSFSESNVSSPYNLGRPTELQSTVVDPVNEQTIDSLQFSPERKLIADLSHFEGYQVSNGFSYPRMDSQKSENSCNDSYTDAAGDNLIQAFSSRSFTLSNAIITSSSQTVETLTSSSTSKSGHNSVKDWEEMDVAQPAAEALLEIELVEQGDDTKRSESLSGNPLFSTDQKNSTRHYCHLCPSSFPRPSGLQTHLRHHTGVRPFACPVLHCGKRFSVRSNAKRHLRTHGISTTPEPTHKVIPYSVGFNEPIVSVTEQEVDSPTGTLTWVPDGLRTCTDIDVWRHIRGSEAGPLRTVRTRRRSLTNPGWYSS